MDGSGTEPLSDQELNAVFVYGTLKPGDVRWPIIEPHVVSTRPAAVSGRLYDTGRGYPAAVFDRVGTIRGVVLELAPTDLAEVLELLDFVEGTVSGRYQRVLVTTWEGAPVWAYAFGESTDGLTDLDGHWPDVS